MCTWPVALLGEAEWMSVMLNTFYKNLHIIIIIIIIYYYYYYHYYYYYYYYYYHHYHYHYYLKQLFDAKLLIRRLPSFSLPKITVVRHV